MKALDAMRPANAGERRTLADIIFSKLDNLESGQTAAAQLQEKHHGPSSRSCLLTITQCRTGPDRIPDPAAGLDPKVVEVYTKYVCIHRDPNTHSQSTLSKSESGRCSPGTSQVRYPSHSKLSHPCRNGRVYSRSRTQRIGHHKHAMPRRAYSFRR